MINLMAILDVHLWVWKFSLSLLSFTPYQELSSIAKLCLGLLIQPLSPSVFQSKTRQLLNCFQNNLLVHETSPPPPLNYPRNQPNIFVQFLINLSSYQPMEATLFLELITFNTKIEQISSKIIMKWKISSDYSVKNNHHY